MARGGDPLGDFAGLEGDIDAEESGADKTELVTLAACLEEEVAASEVGLLEEAGYTNEVFLGNAEIGLDVVL